MFALDIHLLRVSSCKLRGPLEIDSGAQKQVGFGVETQGLLRSPFGMLSMSWDSPDALRFLFLSKRLLRMNGEC